MALPDEIEHFLDAAPESGEMTTAAALALRLYGDPVEIGLIHADRDPRTVQERAAAVDAGAVYSSKRRLAICMRLEVLAISLARGRGDLERAGFYELARRSIEASVQMYATFLANSHVDDEVYGGCLRPFKRRPRVQGDRPTRPALARIKSPRIVRETVKRDREIAHMRAIWRLWDDFPAPTDQAEVGAQHVLAIAERARLEEAARRAATREAYMDRYRSTQAAIRHRDVGLQRQFPLLDMNGPNPRFKRRSRAYQRAAKRAQRAVIKRSLRVAMCVIGEDATRDLVAGRSIELPAGDFSLVLRAPRPSARGHGAVSIRLVDLQGLPLASVCVYQSAPAFDQVASIALYAGAGRAMDIIETGNLFQIEPTAVDHPAIAAKVRARSEITIQAGRLRHDRIDLDPLFREIKPMVIEIVETFVLGRRRHGCQVSFV